MTRPVAFVTGTSRGIGAELARLLVAEGFEVHGCATRDAFGAGVVGYVCDISDAAAVDAMFNLVEERVGRLDLLVNNAALLGPRTTIEETSPREWARVFAVNAHGAFHVSRRAVKLLRAGSVIVNVSSSVGREGRANWGAYACSKHALEGLTEVLADELREQGVIVLSLNPGGTATAMRADAFPAEDPATLPGAAAIAAVIVDRVKAATLADSGAKWNCRDFL